MVWCLPLLIYAFLSVLSLMYDYYTTRSVPRLVFWGLVYAGWAALMAVACNADKSWIAWVLLLLPFILYVGVVVLALLGIIGATTAVSTTSRV